MRIEPAQIPEHERRTAFHIFMFLILLFGFYSLNNGVYAEEANLSMQEITYTSADGVKISGSWIIPRSTDKSRKPRPVVILLHDYGFNRRDWGIFIPDLVQHGYNVLAIDLRGHGQSRDGGTHSPASLMQEGPFDVQAALAWVKTQKNSDHKKISLIGAGVGADIAYLCSGRFNKKIKTAVVISPSYTPVIDGFFADLKPQAILFCASAKDKRGTSMLAAETLSNFTDDPKKVVIYNSAAHGLAMFYKHPEIKQEILNWLSR